MTVAFVSPDAVDERVLAGLLPSFWREGLELAELYSQIVSGDLKVFVVGDGNSRCYTAVSVLQTAGVRELAVQGLWVENPGQGWRFRTWLWFLKNLAKEWNCDKVTTAVSDVRQLRGLLKNGCKVDYVSVSLEIDDGQQENNYPNLQ